MSWARIQRTGRRTYKIRVKHWHPGFWLYVYNRMRRSGGGVWESLTTTVFLLRKAWFS